jgi:hypothetical protein
MHKTTIILPLSNIHDHDHDHDLDLDPADSDLDPADPDLDLDHDPYLTSPEKIESISG